MLWPDDDIGPLEGARQLRGIDAEGCGLLV
jgi:hypothetical protein